MKVKYFDEIIICDFCQNPYCPWEDYTISNPPKHCPHTKVFYLSDPDEDVHNITARRIIAEKVGVYSKEKNNWVFSAPVALSLLPDELIKVIAKLNTFSSLNNFHLSQNIEYKKRMEFKTFTP